MSCLLGWAAMDMSLSLSIPVLICVCVCVCVFLSHLNVSAVMLILSTESAVNTFKSRAQISVGAELGVSVGPVGRSIESDVTAGNKGAGVGRCRL